VGEHTHRQGSGTHLIYIYIYIYIYIFICTFSGSENVCVIALKQSNFQTKFNLRRYMITDLPLTLKVKG